MALDVKGIGQVSICQLFIRIKEWYNVFLLLLFLYTFCIHLRLAVNILNTRLVSVLKGKGDII